MQISTSHNTPWRHPQNLESLRGEDSHIQLVVSVPLSRNLQESADAGLSPVSLACTEPQPETFGRQQPAALASPSLSGSSSPSSVEESPHSSPFSEMIRSADADEADELVELFNIRVEDLLTTNPLVFQYPDAVNMTPFILPSQASVHAHQPTQLMGAEATEMLLLEITQNLMEQQLFLPYQQHLHQQHYQQPQQQPQLQYLNLLQRGRPSTPEVAGPHWPSSLAPVFVGAPDPTTQLRYQIYARMPLSSPSASHSSSSGTMYYQPSCHFLPQPPELQHFIMSTIPPSPIRIYASSPSSPFASPSTTSPSTPHLYMSPILSDASSLCSASPTHGPIEATLSASPSTTWHRIVEGMTLVRNEGGAMMLYDPATETMSFRCELCPDESFGRIHDVRRHQYSKHVKAMKWSCEFCERRFPRRDALLRHYTAKSGREDGVHPMSHELERLQAAKARAKTIV